VNSLVMDVLDLQQAACYTLAICDGDWTHL
jgi:hypothetical protein